MQLKVLSTKQLFIATSKNYCLWCETKYTSLLICILIPAWWCCSLLVDGAMVDGWTVWMFATYNSLVPYGWWSWLRWYIRNVKTPLSLGIGRESESGIWKLLLILVVVGFLEIGFALTRWDCKLYSLFYWKENKSFWNPKLVVKIDHLWEQTCSGLWPISSELRDPPRPGSLPLSVSGYLAPL